MVHWRLGPAAIMDTLKQLEEMRELPFKNRMPGEVRKPGWR